MFLAFPLHFVWEFLQAPLFVNMAALSHVEGIRVCLFATFGDMSIVLSAFWITSLSAGNRNWAASPNSRSVVIWFGVGLAITIIVEFLSTEVWGRWTYGDEMLRLPIAGTGLSPLLQWVIIPMIVLWYLFRLSPSATSANESGEIRSDDG
jgi:hypothetical protein